MIRRLIVPTLAMTLAAALGTVAVAQTPPQEGGPGEGMANMPGLPRTAEEVQPWAERMFTRFDANQDGAITEDELAVLDNPTVGAMGGSMIRMMILRSDADGDSRVTVEELTAGAQRMFERMTSGGGARGGMRGGPGDMLTMPRTADAVQPWAEGLFARLDTNQDGVITGSELAVLANPTVAAMGGSRLRAMIVQSDANRDSRITLEEMTAGAQRMFNRMDQNGDGRLSDTELPQAPARPAPIAIPPADNNPFPEMSDGG